MAQLVIDDALDHCAIGRLLIGFEDGGVDAHAAAVDGILVFFIHGLPGDLGDVIGGHFMQGALLPDLDRFRQCRLVAAVVDETQGVHAPQDVMLAFLRALRIDEGVVT